MSFLVIVTVFLIVQFWGSGTPLHKDRWWDVWAGLIKGKVKRAEIELVLQVVVPVVLLWWCLSVVESLSPLLLFLVSVPLLLYCLGRGDFSAWVKGYIESYHRGDNVMASEYACRMGVDVEGIEGWSGLHRAVLKKAAYRALERMFVSIFWFFFLGGAGALLYRLADFSSKSQETSAEAKFLAARLMWLLEWPVVRAIGLSLALTGNFLGGFQAVKDSLFSSELSTESELENLVHGALNLNGSELTQEVVTEQEVEALQPLLSRTLILWLCVLALIGLF